MRRLSRVAGRALVRPIASSGGRTSRYLASLWLKFARYFETAFDPDDDDTAAAITFVTGGIGAPVLFPSAKAVAAWHEPDSRAGRSEDVRPPQKPLSVLILSTDSKTYGGIQRYAQMWAQAAYELGYRSRTVVLWRGGVKPESRVGPARAARFLLTAMAVALVRRPVAVVATHIGLSPVAWTIGRVLGIPYAVSLHGDDSWRVPTKKSIRRAVTRADLLIPVSHFTREVVRRWADVRLERTYVTGSILSPRLELLAARAEPESYAAALESRSSVAYTNLRCLQHLHESRIPTGFPPWDRASEVGEPAPLEASNGHESGVQTILTVARLDANAPYKRHDLVLRAVAELRAKYPRLRYLVVGDGSYRPHLQRLAETLGVADIVEFTGKLTEDELARCYGTATCFAMPSRISLEPAEGEGFGLVYLEAGIWGVPSVAARAGGSAETVLDGISGLLADPDSPDGVKTALDSILSDPARRRELGRMARIRALEFSYPRFRRRVKAVLHALEAARRSPADADLRSVASSIEPEYPRFSLCDCQEQSNGESPDLESIDESSSVIT